jgi:hypothetical protein
MPRYLCNLRALCEPLAHARTRTMVAAGRILGVPDWLSGEETGRRWSGSTRAVGRTRQGRPGSWRRRLVVSAASTNVAWPVVDQHATLTHLCAC